ILYLCRQTLAEKRATALGVIHAPTLSPRTSLRRRYTTRSYRQQHGSWVCAVLLIQDGLFATLENTAGISMTNLEPVRARFARSTGLPFTNVLMEANILDVLNDHGIKYRDRVFNPVTTIWGFLSQVLSEDHSCRDAVARVIAHQAA